MPDVEVAIIGAGLGGIGMGIALRDAGLDDFVLLERAADIGGTWRDNTYPGVAVDVPAQAYQFSYELNPGWSRTFAPGSEVKAYIDRLADGHDIRRHVRTGADVTARHWDEQAHCWRLTVGDPEACSQGRSDSAVVSARFVISAIGAFVDPKPVDIPGAADFTGPVLRSACWDHSVELAGNRVAVIGTGASAVQIVPEIAPVVGRLTVFQRTPIWVVPKLDPPTPGVLQELYRRAPRVQDAVRAAATRATEMMIVDAVLGHHRAPAVNHGLAWLLKEVWYRAQVRDEDVRDRLTPDYGLGCKRPSLSNSYLRTFNRGNVELVTDPIERITPVGVRTATGTEHEADVLVLATGFRMASDPETFRRTPVRGRDGFDLAERYTDHRLASYESISQPGLPNHFMIFGPYGWTGGTWHQLVESASAHIVRVINEAQRRGATAVEVRQEACDRWTAKMRGRMTTSLFATNSCGTANSYYFDHHGDTPYLRPTSAASAARAARTFPLDDYRYEPIHHTAGRPA